MAERYTYNAIAEHPIIPEYDDNEEKFKWNGALLNLSDLPVSEYTKTVYNISGEITGSTPSVPTNVVTVDCVNTGETYEVIATMQYPSETEITVTVSVEGEAEPVSVTVAPGNVMGRRSLTRSSSSPRPAVTNPSVSPVKDENYTYQVSIAESVVDKFKAYYGVWLEMRLSGLTSDVITSMNLEQIDSEGMLLKYMIPQADVQITEEQIEYYKYALILAIPKSVYDGGYYSLLEHTFQSDAEFVKKEDMLIGTTQYTILYRVSEGMQFVSRYMQTIEYDFDLKYTE